MNHEEAMAADWGIPVNIVTRAIVIFGSPSNAEHRLRQPLPLLDGESAVRRLKKAGGVDVIDAVLRKIEFGEFS